MMNATATTTETTTEPKPLPLFPLEVLSVIDRANSGDESALPALRRALGEHPELVSRLGDLAAHAERGLIELASGGNLPAREAITRHAAQLRADLGEAEASPLEKVLIARLVVCWVGCYAAENDRAARLLEPNPESSRTAAEKRLDRAHARLISAAKALATVRKLVRPGLSPVELAIRPVPETRPGVNHRLRQQVSTVAN